MKASASSESRTYELPVHHGQNIRRIRLLLGLNQKQLAARLGQGWTQKKVSRVETSPSVVFKVRLELAESLKVDMELFEEFDEAAGRLALMQMMKYRQLARSFGSLDDLQLMEGITELLEGALSAVHRESQNMQLLLRLLQQVRFNAGNWLDKNRPAGTGEVKEPGIRLWRVA